MLSINLAKPARKAIEKLLPKHVTQVLDKIDALAIDPEPADSSSMKGKAREWRRVTCGEYRIIYRVENNSLEVALVGLRNDGKVYRDFERKL